MISPNRSLLSAEPLASDCDNQTVGFLSQPFHPRLFPSGGAYRFGLASPCELDVVTYRYPWIFLRAV